MEELAVEELVVEDQVVGTNGIINHRVDFTRAQSNNFTATCEQYVNTALLTWQ